MFDSNTNYEKKLSNSNEQPLIINNTSIVSQNMPVEIKYEVSINAKMKNKQIKSILSPQTGIIPSNSFTAILGPSGCGKTTLLNFLSGRFMSNNLQIKGQIKFNSILINSIELYSNQIGYVMQNDTLLPTLTPKQCFQFAANLKLIGSKQQKENIVQNLLIELGLIDCADTRVGNNFIKGISGGERKRTSIGIELITNPNILFLDEPTTGLDSTTALQVIQLLKRLTLQMRTIVITVHQPSSQISCEFDRLMLLVDGRCIYHANANKAEQYFKQLGYNCPPMMNSAEFYLNILSLHFQDEEEQSGKTYQQIKQKHTIEIIQLENKFKQKIFQFETNQDLKPLQIIKNTNISFIYQLFLICHRTLITQIRNPMDVTFKILQSIFTSIIVIIVYGEIDNSSLQNVSGLVFFLVSNGAFGGIQGTLATFSAQRPIFIRQRFSKFYSTISYFIGRTMTNFPFQLIYPTISLIVVYWATNLGNRQIQPFWHLLLTVNALYFCSASYGLLYASIFSNLETALSLVGLLIIPFMLLGGFFINLDDKHDIRVIFYPIMYLSPFKYGFQACMISLNANQSQYKPSQFSSNIFILIGIGFGVRIISLIIMQLISNPKRNKITNMKIQ